jgi:hypothetical protein
MDGGLRASRCRVAWVVALLTTWVGGAAGASAAEASVKAVAPDDSGFAKLLCASPYGGKGTESFVGAGILQDHSIVLAGNAQLTSLRKGTGRGFLLRLTMEGEKPAPGRPIEIPGHINRMKISPSGHLCLLIDNAGVHMLRPGTSKPIKSCSLRGILDFAVDSSGEIVVLHGRNMTRYDRTWKRRKWSVTWHAYGGNRPGGMAVCPKTGIAAVVGYGMTHTGREPWKDPYAYGFDRAGKQIWKLWDPKPGLQVSGSHGGNGLMADTTGKFAKAGGDGKVYLSLYADGGNSVCTRDPANPDERIAPEVYEGVYQRGPGHGFKGASKTSVAFRVDAAGGKLEKGTWMCAWLSPQRANGLGMDDLAVDEKGRVYIAGGSASACPTKAPWYRYSSGYMGGGFLAVFDEQFRMLQCGAFQQTSMSCVAAACGYAVAAGHVKPPDAENTVCVHRPIQKDIAGGESDGYFVILSTGPHGKPAGGAAVKPAAENVPKRLLAEARQAIADRKALAAGAKLRYILARYPASPEAAEARTLLAQLAAAKPEPKLAGTATTEEQAGKLLQKAENYLRNDMKSLARSALRQIVRDFPQTAAAKTAQNLLDEHFAGDD